jgi:alpha-glucosidase
MVMLLFACLRGNIIIWQGEELGLTQVDIAFEDLKDPEAIANWPLTLSRDGTRTPMPWEAERENCGFSSAKPWLPLGDDHAELAIDRQTVEAESLLNITRRLIAFRKAHDALLIGKLEIIEAQGDLLVFERIHDGQHLLCAFNLGRQPIDWHPAQPDRWRIIESINQGSAKRLPAYSAYVAERLA